MSPSEPRPTSIALRPVGRAPAPDSPKLGGHRSETVSVRPSLRDRLVEIVADYADRLLPTTLRPPDPLSRLRARLMVLYTALILVVPCVFAFIAWGQGMSAVAGTLALTCVLGALTTVVLRASHSVAIAGHYAAATYSTAHLATLLLLGGFNAGSYYWLATTPVFAAILVGMRACWFWLVVVTVEAVLSYAAAHHGLLGQQKSLTPWAELASQLGLGGTLVIMIGTYERVKDDLLAGMATTAEQLAIAREKAELATMARTTFLAHMSHEIRTPMNGVIGMADLLLSGGLTPSQQKSAEIILDSSRALIAIIDDILDFAKAETGHLTLDKRPTDIRAVVDAVVALLGERARAGDLTMTRHFSADVPQRLMLDAGRLRQVLLNLVGNALKFTKKGTVHVAVAVANGRLQFAVQDTGIGIAREALAGLFQPFSQVDASITRRYGGTGLGLAICRQIVEAMGGQIHVESQVGQGTTFSFTIAIEGASEHLGAAEPNRVAGQFGETPRKILIVEDNDINRLVVRRILERFGHACSEAPDGTAALQRLQQEHFDLVLMDCQMPGMDGFSATRVLRATPGLNQQVPVVALTAQVQPEDHARCLDAGMDGYLRKPVDAKSLSAELSQRWRVPSPTTAAALAIGADI